jgi:hypothetical protein
VGVILTVILDLKIGKDAVRRHNSAGYEDQVLLFEAKGVLQKPVQRDHVVISGYDQVLNVIGVDRKSKLSLKPTV